MLILLAYFSNVSKNWTTSGAVVGATVAVKFATGSFSEYFG
jgi:hypothetical protein